jgi:hypothetical protein
MGQSVDLRLRSGNAYEVANDFYFNKFIDGEMFCACVIKQLDTTMCHVHTSEKIRVSIVQSISYIAVIAS